MLTVEGFDRLKRQLIRDEGVRLKPYRDSVGKLTIGIGRNLDDVGISSVEAEVLLKNDMRDAASEVQDFFPWTMGLNEARLAVLIAMRFNLGLQGLQGFRKMLEACSAGDYEEAAKQMLDSKWENQVGLRAHRLAKQMEVGEWQ